MTLQSYLIGSFSTLTGISKRMLRHFDQIGLLSPHLSDTTTGYRFYCAQQISQVKTIATLQKFGFSLKEIQSLTQSEITVEAFLGLLKNQEALLRNSVDEGVSQLLRIKECIDLLSKNYNNRIENETPLNPSSYILDLKDPDFTLDLDNFMHVNDQYGYAMGDQVIHVFYLLIEQTFSRFFDENKGFMSRLGGDEYAVVIYNTPLDSIDHALQTMVDAINEYTFLHEDKTFHLSTSCGGCYVDEKLLKDSKELISKKTITSDNFTQHLRHESTKVLIDVKRVGRNNKQIKVLR